MDAIIIGGGLFGQTIASELLSIGKKLVIIDNDEPQSGSKPSASLMKPSWMKQLTTEQQDQSYSVLDKHFGVHDLSFKVGPLKVDTVRWCDPEKIRLAVPPIRKNVIKATPGTVHFDDDEVWEARTVIVAAGYWSNDILYKEHQAPGLDGRVGASYVTTGAQLPDNFISVWAPYKQLVAFNIDSNRVWVGDGTALKVGNLTDERLAQSTARARGVVTGDTKMSIGIRPYMPKSALGKAPCHLAFHQCPHTPNDLIVATGGAKNGTIAAGWAAYQIARYME